MLPNMTEISFYQLSREQREEINQRSNSHSKGEKILLTFQVSLQYLSPSAFSKQHFLMFNR